MLERFHAVRQTLGYDAAGVVVEAGRETRLFKPGDEVFYAGSIGRQGANAEYHLVDESALARFPRRRSTADLDHRLGGDVRPARRRQTRSRRYAGDSDRRRRWRRRFDRHPIGAAADLVRLRVLHRLFCLRGKTTRWLRLLCANSTGLHGLDKDPLIVADDLLSDG